MSDDLFSMTFQTMRQALSASVSNKDWLSNWERDVSALRDDLQKYHASLERIVRSGEFTEVGKAKRKQEAQALLRERLQAEAEHIAGYVTHIDRLKVVGTKKAAPTDLQQVLHTLELHRLQDRIEGMDPVIVRGEYEARVGDASGRYDLWVEAAERAQTPMGEPFLPGEIIDRGHEARELRRMDPDTRQQLADLMDKHGHSLLYIRAD